MEEKTKRELLEEIAKNTKETKSSALGIQVSLMIIQIFVMAIAFNSCS